MGDSFLNKINSAYKKGMEENPQFKKAIHAIDIIAKGENAIEAVKDRDVEELEV